MYTFTDTIEQPRGAERPAEALSIDGVWLEDVVPGYRTLYVSGRELLAQGSRSRRWGPEMAPSFSGGATRNG
ncbi:MAG: hypothetical protein ACLVHV_17065 [Oscillospiraceae bacterium]